MNTFWARACVAVALLAAALLSTPAVAKPPRYILPEPSRLVDGGRSVRVLVPQVEINAEVNEMNGIAGTSPGFLPAVAEAVVSGMVAQGVNASRGKKAESVIEPLRESLRDFDVNGLAVRTTDAALSPIAWFGAQPASFGRDAAVAGKEAQLDANPTAQTAFVEYDYEFLPDFSGLQISAIVQVASKAVTGLASPEARLEPRHLVYAQTLTSVVKLPSASKVKADNLARWTAENGAMTRRALVLGFGTIGKLFPFALNLTQDDVDRMTDRPFKEKTIGGYTGFVEESSDARMLMFKDYPDGIIDMRTLSP